MDIILRLKEAKVERDKLNEEIATLEKEIREVLGLPEQEVATVAGNVTAKAPELAPHLKAQVANANKAGQAQFSDKLTELEMESLDPGEKAVKLVGRGTLTEIPDAGTIII